MTRSRFDRLMKALGITEYAFTDMVSHVFVSVPYRVCALVTMFLRREWPRLTNIGVCSLNLLLSEP